MTEDNKYQYPISVDVGFMFINEAGDIATVTYNMPVTQLPTHGDLEKGMVDILKQLPEGFRPCTYEECMNAKAKEMGAPMKLAFGKPKKEWFDFAQT